MRTYLAHQNILLIEMPPEHFRRFSRDRLDLDADFFTFPGSFDLFVIALNARHNTNVEELKKKRKAWHEKHLVGSIVGSGADALIFYP